jgi:hypothetical protein
LLFENEVLLFEKGVLLFEKGVLPQNKDPYRRATYVGSFEVSVFAHVALRMLAAIFLTVNDIFWPINTLYWLAAPPSGQ